MKETAIITTNEAGDNFFVESSLPLTKEQQDAIVQFTMFYRGNIAVSFLPTEPITITDMVLLDTATHVDINENFYMTMFNSGVSENIQTK